MEIHLNVNVCVWVPCRFSYMCISYIYMHMLKIVEVYLCIYVCVCMCTLIWIYVSIHTPKPVNSMPFFKMIYTQYIRIVTNDCMHIHPCTCKYMLIRTGVDVWVFMLFHGTKARNHRSFVCFLISLVGSKLSLFEAADPSLPRASHWVLGWLFISVCVVDAVWGSGAVG